MASYQYMMAGKKYHEFLGQNMPGISRSTVARHLKAHTKDIEEGEHAHFK